MLESLQDAIRLPSHPLRGASPSAFGFQSQGTVASMPYLPSIAIRSLSLHHAHDTRNKRELGDQNWKKPHVARNQASSFQCLLKDNLSTRRVDDMRNAQPLVNGRCESRALFFCSLGLYRAEAWNICNRTCTICVSELLGSSHCHWPWNATGVSSASCP